MTTDTQDTPLQLSDIAAEIGFDLEEITPQEQPAAEETEDAPEAQPEATDTEDASAETDLSQDTDKTEDDSDAESEDDAEPEEEKNPVPEKLLKRIDKITAKRREAEERAETLESEVSELRAKLDATVPIQITPTASDPLADVENAEQLEDRVATAKKIRAWAIKNLEGGTVQNAAGEEVYYEPSQVREYLATADELLTEHAPKRQQWIAQRSMVLPEARSVYPALFKAGTQEHESFKATLKAHPYLKGLPQLEMIVGDAMEGMKLRFARAEAMAKKSAASRAESKSPVKSSNPPSPAKGARVPAQDIANREGARNLFTRGSSLKTDDIAAYLEGAL
jgi:hypothetical protein